MHYMPDEDEDTPEEDFWPDSYKQVFKNEFRQLIREQLAGGEGLQHVYRRQYAEKFADFNQFLSLIADMGMIGAENGADDSFDNMLTAFLYECPLPEIRRYARYLLPEAFPETLKEKLKRAIIDDYRDDGVYNHAYQVGYYGRYSTFDEFLDRVAEVAVTGALNGADDMMAAIYRAFVTSGPLPPARQRPRRLKIWVVPSGSVKREAPV